MVAKHLTTHLEINILPTRSQSCFGKVTVKPQVWDITVTKQLTTHLERNKLPTCFSHVLGAATERKIPFLD